jgi:AcrR family transcriptional regulator
LIELISSRIGSTVAKSGSYPGDAGPSRNAKKAQTSGRVTDVARAIFLRDGYKRATIRDIAAAAGVSSGTVSAQYGSKSALFAAVLREEFLRGTDIVRAADPVELKTRERISAIFSALYAYHAQGLDIMRAAILVGWQDLPATDSPVSETWRALRQYLQEVLQDGVARGELRDSANCKLAAQMLMDHYVNGYQRAFILNENAEQLSARIAQMFDLMHAGMAA